MNLYIYSYNNYYNRILKKAGDLLSDYESFLHYGPVTGVYGFTPSDGINTTQVIGSNVNMYDGKGDYLIAHDPVTNTIDSRWFIIDSNRNRSGQWTLTLHRDLMVDYYDSIINAPCFIEKATLTSDNPLIFNKESIHVNQIKTSETQLKDETGCAWIVGYYDNKVLQTNPDAYKIETSIDVPFDVAVNSTFQDWEFSTATSIKGPMTSDMILVNTKISYQDYRGVKYRISFKNPLVDTIFYTTSTLNTTYNQGVDVPTPLETIKSALSSNRAGIESAIRSQFELPSDNSGINKLLSFNNKIVRFLDGQGGYVYYNIEVIDDPGGYDGFATLNSDLFTQLKNALNTVAVQEWTAYSPNGESFLLHIAWTNYSVKASLAEGSATSLKITADANQLQDAPYSMFALPYPDENKTFVFDNGVEMTRELSLSIAMALSINAGSSIYDLQLLPYCPFRKIIDPVDNTFSVSDLVLNQDYAILARTSVSPVQPLGYIFFPQKSSFTVDIPLETAIEYSDVKMRNQCDMWRLVSPNYNGQFEFNAMRNGGVERFNVDCTYLPYQPYIHLNPNFGKLYGKDFNDARGLICGGDFSLPRESDAWQNYKLQNKNFQEVFDRQIQNMDRQQEAQRIGDIVGTIAGTGSGAASGALAGSMAGGGYGAIAGAGIGAVASAAGGIADYFINEKLRTEAINYTTDLFNFNLDNIKALPQSISKTTAYTYNNKIYPILEYYTCTDIEKEAVANKIAYNGMTIMVIGKIKDYINNTWVYGNIKSKGYIKGKLINLELPVDHKLGLHAESYDVINAISRELDKGVFTSWE